jgi:hypothetical protein
VYRRGVDDDLDEPAVSPGPVSTPAIVGIVADVIPFFVHFGTTTTTTINGVVESASTNYVAIGGGGLAIAAGVFALATAKSSGSHKWTTMAVAAAVILVGVGHLLVGSGVI